MTVTIDLLTPADQEAVSRLLDGAVGAGFWSLERADESLPFVARVDGAAIGVVLACLAPGDHGATLLHVRELAVAAGHRRGGVATRLLRRAERAGRARGASLALVYAWLPAGTAEPESVPFYSANGYAARRDIPGFYGASSVQLGAVCPYCGDPPCRCAARVFVKEFAAPA